MPYSSKPPGTASASKSSADISLYQLIHYNGYAESGYHGFIGSAGGYAYGTAKIIFCPAHYICKGAECDSFKAFALLFGSILHSSLVVYNTVIILFPSGIVKQTAGIIRVKKQALCELFVKIRKKSEKGLTK